MRKRKDAQKDIDLSTRIPASRRSSRRNRSRTPLADEYKQNSASISPPDGQSVFCENMVSIASVDCAVSSESTNDNSRCSEALELPIVDKVITETILEEASQRSFENSIEFSGTNTFEEESPGEYKLTQNQIEIKQEPDIPMVTEQQNFPINDSHQCEDPKGDTVSGNIELNQIERSIVGGENINASAEEKMFYIKVLKEPPLLGKISQAEEDDRSIKGVKSLETIEDSSKNIRKRKWISKKGLDSKEPILAISTDSLKGLIAGVDIVPLSDVKFDSSSEKDSTHSDLEEGEDVTPERYQRKMADSDKDRVSMDSNINNRELDISLQEETISRFDAVISNSPQGTETGSILFITNLVRPFTVLQLKGLLARTGNIAEDGFWIDRIKSKCYVRYETEDQAVETRHALHGVRWPPSNPKFLSVEFGKKEDMDKAIRSAAEGFLKCGSEFNKEFNNGVDLGNKRLRPVREWDVGKKDSVEKVKKRGFDRNSDRRVIDSKSLDSNDDYFTNIRENGRDRKYRREKSISPPAKKSVKKENDPPIRLLDDLFRKTITTPCIYWLPLTPEQIAEKELLRQKRIEEHKERVKQREMERSKGERERDREREKQGNDKVRDSRRNRSSDRRRSKSRERRRNK